MKKELLGEFKFINISDYYNIIQNISFNVKEGSFCFIIGKSGSGKTTLLKLIANINDKKTGKILFREEEINENNDIIFHSFYPLLNSLSIYENIEPFLRKVSISNRVIKIRKILSNWSMENMLFNNINNLSLGEKQRINMARLLAFEPKLLLMDEPFCHLDLFNKKNIIKDIISIRKSNNNITGIIVTHTFEEIMELSIKESDSIIVIEKGRMICHSSFEEVYDKPESIEVATATGYINHINAFLVDINKDQYIISINKRILKIEKSNICFSNINNKYNMSVSILIRPELIEINADKEKNNTFKVKEFYFKRINNVFHYYINIEEIDEEVLFIDSKKHLKIENIFIKRINSII